MTLNNKAEANIIIMIPINIWKIELFIIFNKYAPRGIPNKQPHINGKINFNLILFKNVLHINNILKKVDIIERLIFITTTCFGGKKSKSTGDSSKAKANPNAPLINAEIKTVEATIHHVKLKNSK